MLIIVAGVFYMNKAIGLIFLLYVPVVIIGTTFQGKKLATMQSDAIAKQDMFLSSLKTSIDYKREINILKGEKYFMGKFSENMRTWEKFILKLKFLKALLEEFPGIATNIFGAVYLLFAATLIQRAELSLGELVMGYQYLGLVAGPLSYIAYTFLTYKADKEHIVRVDELAGKTQVDTVYEKLKTNKDYLISAKRLKLYSDDDKENMLFETDILCMKKKGLYVLKGSNGVGKSLLLNYIINSISSNWASGEISIAKDIEDTAFLTYPLFFIEGNFRDNLFHKKYDLDILKMLNIDFEGKEINTNPINLSLGQQQKLGLLRVLSMNSNYVFLDEPFSNLDVETQRNLTEYINELKEIKTVVVIMHDETLDSLADEIYIIKSKQLELIKADGIRSFAN
ncbi:MAG: hypothetical protein COA82_05710 [Alkaliphilus sp.]|nr:MAG: hypothetical protein COA82_05710 [Alkaliphilus sp.]